MSPRRYRLAGPQALARAAWGALGFLLGCGWAGFVCWWAR
jgi:hypothetical protein